jgi:hypothetical protein
MESDFTRKTGNIPSVDDPTQLPQKTEMGYKLDYSEYWKTLDIKGNNLMRHLITAKGANKCASNKLMMLESVVTLLYPEKGYHISTTKPIEPSLTPTEYANLKITITKEKEGNKKIDLKGRNSSQIRWESGATFSNVNDNIFKLVFFGSNNVGSDSGMSGILGATAKNDRESQNKKIIYELIDNDGKLLKSESISIKKDKDKDNSEYYFIEINLDKITLNKNESTVFRVIAKFE